MSQVSLFLIMFCAGVAVAIQPAINARLAEKAGITESAFISFAVGTIALFIVVLSTGKLVVRPLGETTWWEWSGGILGAGFVTATILIVPRIGTAGAMAATIAAQLTTGLILDQFGLFGLRQISFDLKRGLGAFLLLVGAVLVFRR